MNRTNVTSPQKLAMINSFAGYGHCSTAVALPIISAMGIQVCPLPTTILSNHLGFPACHSYSFTDHMAPYTQAWKENQASFNGLYCGYLGEAAQIDHVSSFIKDFQPPLVVLDPVMGDHGRLYRATTAHHCERLRELLPHAHVITPNLTECCILTDTRYPVSVSARDSKAQAISPDALEILCSRLAALTSAIIVLTGVPYAKGLANAIYQKGQLSIHPVEITGPSRHGTGDAFGAVLTGCLMQGRTIKEAVDTASEFVSLCIAASDAAAIPPQEGLYFEACLKTLL